MLACDFGSLCDTIRIWKQRSDFKDFVCEKIINDLEPLLEQIGINDINDLVGRSHKF